MTDLADRRPDSLLRHVVWGPCPGCGGWQVGVAEDLLGGDTDPLPAWSVSLVDDAFRDHARVECPGLAELIAVRGMRAKPPPRVYVDPGR
jgi:hypothetical protein